MSFSNHEQPRLTTRELIKNPSLYPSKSNILQFMFIASGWVMCLFTPPASNRSLGSCFRRGLMTYYPYRGNSIAAPAIGLDLGIAQFIHLKTSINFCRVCLWGRKRPPEGRGESKTEWVTNSSAEFGWNRQTHGMFERARLTSLALSVVWQPTVVWCWINIPWLFHYSILNSIMVSGSVFWSSSR